MIYLYLKIHNKTGLKYLGKTVQEPYKYRGSGVRWCNHIAKHGYDVTTKILLESESIDEIKAEGLRLSAEWNIIESDEFANLIEENGMGGGTGLRHTLEVRQKIAKASRSRKHSEESKQKISEAKKGKVYSEDEKQRVYGGRRGRKMSASARKHLSELKKGVPRCEETRRKISEGKKGKARTQVTCPHCGKTGGEGSMRRWHFDNCRTIISS